MEDHNAASDYSKEMEVAVRIVHMACLIPQILQQTSLPKLTHQIQSKDHNSPLTIVDWSVQASVSWALSDAFGTQNVSIVAEQDLQSLSKANNAAAVLESVVKTVNQCLADAPRFGLKAPVMTFGTTEVVEAIGRCNSTGGPNGRFWVLGPADGDRYNVGLALIEDGEIVVGVIGCPNYPMKKEWLSYDNGYRRIISQLVMTTCEYWDGGCVIYARKGSGKAWMQPLIHGEKRLVWPNCARRIQVSHIHNLALATFCDPLEKPNSTHSFTAGLANSVGLRNQQLRVYGMAKYAAIARGDADVFMNFARAAYKEKIWDHAAGALIIQEAGGVVTDAGGQPLDFSKGIDLQGLDRGIIACAGPKLHDNIISAIDASWLIEECWDPEYIVRPTFSEIIVRLDKIVANCSKP